MTDLTKEVLRLEAAIAGTPGIFGALMLVAASYRADAEALGAAMTPGQREEALSVIAQDLLLHHPDLAEPYGSWPAALRGLVLVLAHIVGPGRIVEVAAPSGPVQ